MLLSSSSRISVTSLSTVSGAAPSSTVVTETIGTSTFGKKSTPTRPSDTQPRPTSAPMSITARTGRRMERSESHIAVLDRDAQACGEGRLAARHEHPLPRGEPALDLERPVGQRPYLYGAALGDALL